MAQLLESLAELENWEEYRLFMRERLKQLSDGPQEVFISKNKLDFDDNGKKWKGRAILIGPKGALAVKKVKKEGVLFHEGTATLDGKEIAIAGIDKMFQKSASLTLKRMKLGYVVKGVDPDDETDDSDESADASSNGAASELEEDEMALGEASGAATTDTTLLKRRLTSLVEQIKRNTPALTPEIEPFLDQARARAKEAAKLLGSDPAKAVELIAEGEEFANQAVVGVLEGGSATEAFELEKQRQTLVAELKEAEAVGEAANEALLKQAKKALEAVLVTIGKKDYDKARQLLDAVEQQLSLVVEGPDTPGDPDLVGLGDWKAYRAFLKAQLKRMPAENSPIFVSREKLTFSIDGKEFKGHAILFGPKGRITAQVLKRDGTLFMEGSGRVDGTSIKIGGIKSSLIKGAAKTMIKLRLGKKVVAEGELPPEEDDDAFDAADDPTGKFFVDRQVKKIAESLVKLKEALDAQKGQLTALTKDAADKRKRADDLTTAARAKSDAGNDATKDWDDAAKAVKDADLAQFTSKDVKKQNARGFNSLREMTERLNRIKGSSDDKSKKVEQLKKLKADVAERLLDATIANIDPADPKAGKLIASQLEKRFGVKFKLNESKITGVDADGNQIFKDNDRKADPKKEAETLKELYLTLSKCPEMPKSHLKKVTVSLRPADSESEGGVYYGSSKTAEITCRRPKESFDYGKQLNNAWTANNDPINYFDWATLHEVAHAVDAKYNFMGSRKSGTKYGGWVEYGNDPAPIAKVVAAKFGGSLTGDDLKSLEAYALKRMKAKPQSGPAPTTPEETEVQKWVDAVRHNKGLWWNASQSSALAIGSRVYQEAYAFSGGWWNSYDLAGRSDGIHGYQFRAPGEWFAELYAAYYSDKLKASHPIVPELVKLEPPK